MMLNYINKCICVGPEHDSQFKRNLSQNMTGIIKYKYIPFYINTSSFATSFCSFGAMTCFAFAEHVKKVYNLEPIHMFLSGASAPYVSVICSVCCHICQLKIELKMRKQPEPFCTWKETLSMITPHIMWNSQYLQNAKIKVLKKKSYTTYKWYFHFMCFILFCCKGGISLLLLFILTLYLYV